MPGNSTTAESELSPAETERIRARVRLMIEITARGGRFRGGLLQAAERLTPEEAAIVADLETHGLDVTQLRDLLHGAHVLLRAVQFGHARAELDEHRGVGYERRSKSTACVPPAGVAAPSAGVKRRPARPRPWSVVAALDPQPPCAAGWQGTSCPEGTTAGRTATAAAAADRAAVRRSDRPPAPTARSLSGRTATPTRGRRA